MSRSRSLIAVEVRRDDEDDEAKASSRSLIVAADLVFAFAPLPFVLPTAPLVGASFALMPPRNADFFQPSSVVRSDGSGSTGFGTVGAGTAPFEDEATDWLDEEEFEGGLVLVVEVCTEGGSGELRDVVRE